MVTGDNLITARAIARNCGIIDDRFSQDKYSIMEGPKFFEEVGGLQCNFCKLDPNECKCDPKKMVEGVRNKEKFK